MTQASIPSPQELVDRAIAMQPVLRERAAEARELRRIPDETIADFQQAGFFRIVQPARYGGYEMNPKHLYDVVFEVARACPSSGWVLGVVGVHSWQLGLLDDQAQQDVWAEDNSVLISSSYAPKGQVEIVDGGYRFSGKWGFSSGSDHCDWIFVGGIIPSEGDDPVPRISSFLIPRSDYRIEDDWHTTCLQGSGSKSLVVEDAFVPEHRVHSFMQGYMCEGPGQAVNTGPLFRLPFGQVFIRSVGVPAIGAAQGALDAYCEYNASRLNSVGMKSSEMPASQLAAAKAAAAISTARIKMHHAYDSLMACAEREEIPGAVDRASFRCDAALAVDECVKVVQELLANSGGSAIYEGHRVNEIFQDMLAFRAHAANQPDAPQKNLGLVLFGQQSADFFS